MTKWVETELGKFPADWDYLTLITYLDLITYGFTNPMPTTNDGPFMITAKDINKGRILYEFARHTSQEAYENLLTDKSRPRLNDILLTKDGSIGRLAILNKCNVCINQSVALLRTNSKIKPLFLKYLLESPIYQRKIEIDAGGSTIKHVYITRIDKMNIAVPNISEQIAITSVLSSIENKIEILQKQNKTLEKIACIYFYEWFVKFNFPDKNGKPYKAKGGKMVDSKVGQIPMAWSVKGLSEIANFLNGLALQKFPSINDQDILPVVKIREMHAGITAQTDKCSRNIDSKFIVDNGDVIFSWSGSLEVVLWRYGKGALNQHLFKVTSEAYPKWFYYYWILEHLSEFRQIAASKATTMGHIQRHHLDEALVFVPDDRVMQIANELLTPIIDKQIMNNKQIETLSHLRDTILPKLMSGQLRVKE